MDTVLTWIKTTFQCSLRLIMLLVIAMLLKTSAVSASTKTLKCSTWHMKQQDVLCASHVSSGASKMQTSDEGIRFIKIYEGLRLEAYLCPAGVWTIGYGHTGGVKKGMYISDPQAETLLRKDLRRFERAVNAQITVPLSQVQFDVLVSFVYNVGTEALRTSTLRRKLNQGDYSGAAKEFPRWVKSRGKTTPGLVKRRASERERFIASQ